MDDQKKGPTVTVSCSVQNGVQIALHQIHKGFMGQETRVPMGDIVTLKQGDNPGIDKEFYELWLAENSQLSIVQNGMITAREEKPPAGP
jgi:hypothetical protein